MAKVGYARVSTGAQHTDGQEQRLKDAECERIFVDQGASGAKASRPEWDKCREYLRPGDQLVCTKLDRVGRSVRNLVDLMAWLGEQGADLLVLDQGIDTKTPGGRLAFHIFAAVAEFERDLIIERTRDGLAATTSRGRFGGRPARLTDAQKVMARRLRDDGHSIKEIGVLLGNGTPVSRQTIYRALGMMGR
jgi:DNA invertase Pin-like site-specific DNA recombinase